MKTLTLMTMVGVVSILGTTFGSFGPFCSLAHASSPRLIQTAEGRREWMNEEEVRQLAIRSHEEGHCGGFMDVTEHEDRGPSRAAEAGFDVDRRLTHQTEVNRLLPELSAAHVLATVQKLSSFNNRFYKSDTGGQAARWIRDEFLRLAAGRTDVIVELFNHPKFGQPSVIARIAGHGKRAHEHVVVGAHEDSVNWKALSQISSRAPGADDDASGVATVLEAFRVLTSSGYRPERTLVFVTYAGEEVGLLGSQDVAAKFKKDGVNVVGALQMDMTLFPGVEPKIHMTSDHTNLSLNHFTEALIDEYVRVPWVEDECGYACSDHASWTDEGYPSTFPFEAPEDDYNPNIHTVQDTTDGLNFSFGLHFAKLTTAFMVELGSEK
jgi:leucyl aminopeptidase